MRRWNGWGEEEISYPVPDHAREHLERALGPSSPPNDATLTATLATVPRSRLPDHPLIKVDPEARLRHSRGQSLPDWVALRSGRIETFPDGVAHPESEDQVRALLSLACQKGFTVIPYGGGTSVVGHINPLPGDRPVLSLDMRAMDRLLALDETSRLATLGAGASGPHIESQLNARGFTLGHFPQSWEYSTLGGWIATRSSGQQSYRYGRIEDLFAGGQLETPSGSLNLLPLPASAAGPDLRQWVLGSEGRLGVITQATVRVRPQPVYERFSAAVLPHWGAAVAAARAITQAGVRLSMLRLSDSRETELSMMMAGRERLATVADRALRLLGKGAGRCLAIYAVTGERSQASHAGRAARALLRQQGGLPVGSYVGELWRRDRFRAPYLRNTLWELGYALDTLETALPWSAVLDASREVGSALDSSLGAEGERVLVLTHLSHLYADGASLYFTYLFRLAQDTDLTMERWGRLKRAASEAIGACGGTISHQHGVGLDHAHYLEDEKGETGIRMLQTTLRSIDPEGILNPGKLVQGEP